MIIIIVTPQMRIPLDHFSSVPVFALSPPGNSPEPETPSLVATIKEKMSSLITPDLSVFYSSSSAGSAPSSPVNRRKMSATSQSSNSSRPASAGPVSLPVFTSQGPGCAPVSR